MKVLSLAALVTIVRQEVIADVVLTGPEDLAKQYYKIFPTSNRNAASHKWASFIMQHASSLSHATMKNIFKGFCPVSGSPLPDSPRTVYKVTLPRVTGGEQTGITHHCCWPCICDEHDFIQVDTKTITTTDGPKQYNMFVLGDPCKYPEKLKQPFTDPFSGRQTSLGVEAPELSCSADGKLEGAEYSDNGYPIIGLFFTDAEDAATWTAQPGIDPSDQTFGYGGQCAARRKNGYNSGMGLIFHLLANINPLKGSAAAEPSKLYEVGYSLRAAPIKDTIRKYGFLTMLGAVSFLALAVVGARVALKLRGSEQHQAFEIQLFDWMNRRGQVVALE